MLRLKLAKAAGAGTGNISIGTDGTKPSYLQWTTQLKSPGPEGSVCKTQGHAFCGQTRPSRLQSGANVGAACPFGKGLGKPSAEAKRVGGPTCSAKCFRFRVNACKCFVLVTCGRAQSVLHYTFEFVTTFLKIPTHDFGGFRIVFTELAMIKNNARDT